MDENGKTSCSEIFYRITVLENLKKFPGIHPKIYFLEN